MSHPDNPPYFGPDGKSQPYEKAVRAAEGKALPLFRVSNCTILGRWANGAVITALDLGPSAQVQALLDGGYLIPLTEAETIRWRESGQKSEPIDAVMPAGPPPPSDGKNATASRYMPAGDIEKPGADRDPLAP